MFYFREPLLKLLKRRKIDQVQLARSADVSQGLITKIMDWRGCDSINLSSLAKVCEALDTNVWLLVKKATETKEQG